MAIRGKKTSGIRSVGKIAFRWINNSEERDFEFYARRVFDVWGFDTFGILTLEGLDDKPVQ